MGDPEVHYTFAIRNITTSSLIRNLSHLGIADVNFTASSVGAALQGLGGRLLRLHLDHVYGWDTADLRTVGQFCSKLSESPLVASSEIETLLIHSYS